MVRFDKSCPCYECPERSGRCHCDCERYKVYADKCEQLRQKKMETVYATPKIRDESKYRYDKHEGIWRKR